MMTYKITLTGKVQNVGCRHTFSTIAKENNLTGYVKNLPSGAVELVLQSTALVVDNLLTLAQRKNPKVEFSSCTVELITCHPLSSFEIL